jgi:phosphoglycolate phosphatase
MVATPQTLFFDLDGTLTDPREGITRCIQYALGELNCSRIPEADELLWCIGPPLQQSFALLVGEDQAVRAVALYRERFSDIGLYENTLYPGIREVLENLQAAGLSLQVASSKPHVYVQKILEHFEIAQHFRNVFGAELDGTRSEKTELLEYAIQQTGCVTARATMIGDRHHDATGALNNDIRFVGVLYGYGDREELVAAGADELIAAPQDLTTLFMSRISQ